GSFSADCANEYTLTFKVKVTDDSKVYYENQAKVVYKDRNHEDESDYTNYSNISAFGVKPVQPASVTDKLPDGLTYVGHTDQSGSVSAYNNVTNTVTWQWDDLPYGTTTVTVLVQVEPDSETEFVNKAEVDINGRASETNATYHEILDVTHVKTAHLNEGIANPGTETNPVKVRNNDYITYDILVDNPSPSGESGGFKPKAPRPSKIDFINGSFEQPVISTSSWIQNQSQVNGWFTRPTNPAHLGNPQSEMIEIQKPVSAGGAAGQFAAYAPDGNQYAELNAYVEGTLYQTVDTVPGTKVYWEFYHGARGYIAGNNTDKMNFYLRPEGATTGEPEAVAIDSYVAGSATYNWGHYTGSYVVPPGQTRTEFSFESVSTTSNNTAAGHYLDGIRLYTNSYIDLMKSNNSDGTVTNGEIVEYEIKAKNLGESDASGVVISDVLPAGTELATG
ncbi:MAG TPA: hypothetical protein DEQ02_06870, partial [Ruminococcaceae bacterium]|nr:hypothetical protein [Oscillospiraceae bacterium]